MTNEQLVARIQAGENTAENMLQLWQQTKAYIYKVAKRYSGWATQNRRLTVLKRKPCENSEHHGRVGGIKNITTST